MANRETSAWVPRVYGVGFLLLCLLFVWLTYAFFNQKFTKYDEVTLDASQVGLSLPSRADIKIRGVLVGEVLKTTTHGDGARLTLGLDPDLRPTIPANVGATILPKTLFGEKYVSLDVPKNPSPQPIQPGATIRQSNVSIEVEKVLNDIYPLLRTIRPEQLNYTLTAVANALDGRGNKLGQSFVTLDSYLKRMNPQVPALLDSLENLGKVSSVYRSVVPELSRILHNTVTTAHTFESKNQQVTQLFDDVAGFSDTARQFLRQNGSNMITLAHQGQQILPMFARYSPEYPCFLHGLVVTIPRGESAFRNKTLHIVLETLKNEPRGYNPADKPQNADNRGPFPYCAQMQKAMRGGYSQSNLPPRKLQPQIHDGVQYPIGKRAPVSDAVMGTMTQKAVINPAAGQVLGVSPDRVPDLASLLLGPIARGQAVGVR